ncbi:Crp/Fnr family transcriptional regulator [Arenicella xantha]|uniref:CRP-like cAMP-binding protein n=1 Tax=Arenicella xantha TaxID=644221 RepID=A0A395JLT3_9GAMM|nr:Crp/Fnr family transcriptional regulator [Arenicella xantha]RBP51722.1 CRP-like cAMP-binding protein [Arenicella xantha]
MDLLRVNTPNFMALLSDATTEQLVSKARLMRYSDGQLIHSRGAKPPGLSIVASGSVHVGIYGDDGKFVMTTILGPGECFGEFTLFTELPRTHDVYAGRDCQVHQLGGAVFMRLYEAEPEISRALLKTTLLRSHILLEMLDAIRRLPIPQRTARILLAMSQTSNNPNELICRQDELAYTIGVSRVSLGKALQGLQREGLIELGYRSIRMPDLDKLESWLREI